MTVAAPCLHRLYQDHSPWLLGWLHRRVNDGADAADLLHDTYLRLITSGRLPDSNCPERSRAFLMQIAKGLVIDLHRRRRLERAYLESLAQLPAACVPSEEQRALVLDTLTRVDAALDRLRPRTRSVFLLSRFEHLAYAQISARLDVSVATVRQDMLRATTACLLALAA